MTRMGYRADIDGLRAVAVGAVLVFHFFPHWLPGGFAGVDVFFVISGFLITGVILGALGRGEFSFADFYARRVRRIFPALGLVLGFALAVGWYTLTPLEWWELSKHALAGAGFGANLAHPPGDDYFNTPAQTEPLMHLWSLGIEEQFYLIWPLALCGMWWLAGKGRRGGLLLAGMGALAGVSFVHCIRLVAVLEQDAFYSPFTRTWELLAGAMLAQATLLWGNVRRGRVAEVMSLTGCVMVGFGFVKLAAGQALPGWGSLLPVVGAVLVIGAGEQAWLSRHVLAAKWMVGLGLISYPLYLWHWPLLVFTRIVAQSHAGSLGNSIWNWISVALVILSAGLSWVTFRWVEGPIRYSQRDRYPTWSLVAGLAGVAALALAGYRMMPPRLNTEADRELEVAIRDHVNVGNWMMQPLRTVEFPGGQRQVATLLVGDSHMEQYVPRVKAVIAANPQTASAVLATSGGCPVLPDMNRATPGFQCDRFYRYWYGLAQQKRFGTVAISANWFAYTASLENLERHGKEAKASDYDEAWRQLAVDLQRLREAGKRVVVLEDSPVSDWFAPAGGLNRLGLPRFAGIRNALRVDVEGLNGEASARLRALQRASGVELVAVRDYLCNAKECPVRDSDGMPMYCDGSHLRGRAAEKWAVFVDDVLRR